MSDTWSKFYYSPLDIYWSRVIGSFYEATEEEADEEPIEESDT